MSNYKAIIYIKRIKLIKIIMLNKMTKRAPSLISPKLRGEQFRLPLPMITLIH